MSTQTYQNTITLTDSTEFNRFDTAAYCYLTGVSGTNTVLATGPANMVLTTPQHPVVLVPAVTNTGATTLNITPSGGSALGAKNVFFNGVACVGGELVAGIPVLLVYDGTQYQAFGNAGMAKGSTSTTFTWNGSGGTSSAVTVTWQKFGQFVLMSVPSVTATTGTNSAIFASDTAIAVSARPASTYNASCQVIENNGAVVGPTGMIQITSAGTINIYRDSTGTATFTNTAAAGINGNITFMYFVG